MSSASIEEKVRALVEPIVAGLGIDLYDVDAKGGGSGRMVVRLTIDRSDGGPDDGVTIADCAKVDRMVGPVIEVEGVIPGAYTLEVSSPGVERALRTSPEFIRFQGKRAKVQVARPAAEGQDGPPIVDVLSGLIEDADDQGFTLVPERGEPVRVPYERVRKANLEFRFEDYRDRR